MIGLDTGMHALSLTLQVFLLDLLLSGDNAIVIALACRKLPAKQMRQAIMIGTAAAIALRILFTTIITFLLNVPCLKLLGMFALVAIAIKLLVDEEHDTGTTGSDTDGSQFGQAVQRSARISLWSTVGVIVVADVAMSLDNVIALAAIAQDSLTILIFGLAMSVPLLMYGSLFVSTLFKRYPILIPAGAALLGWVGGDIGMSDPLIADWVTAQAPGLTLVVPLACAVFVLVESKIIQKNQQRFPRPLMAASRAVHELITVIPTNQNSSVLQLEASMSASACQVLDHSLSRIESIAASSAPGTAGSVTGNVIRSSQVGRRHGWFSFVFTRQGSLYLLIAILALPVLGVIGSLTYNAMLNKGLMPRPSPLIRYECPGFNGTFSFFYRHGKDTVQIRANSNTLDGIVHYGKIDWINFAGGTALLGFTPPQEITNDNAKFVRINGGSFLEIDCASTEQNGGS
jgi:YjbE family integral membrane protein